MKNKILVIEDDRAISELLCMNLTIAGYETVATYDGIEAQRLLLWNEDADLAVVDIMLPGKDGFALMEDFRAKNLPVIYLTAKDDVASKVKGLKLGAEDYMVKPFEIVELLARVNIVLRRYNKMEQQLTFKDIAIDTKNQNVSKAGKHIELTPKEFELLELLMRNKNITLFREKIYEEIWGSEYSVESRTLDLHIQRLRKKLDIGDSLKTVFKAGYRLEE